MGYTKYEAIIVTSYGTPSSNRATMNARKMAINLELHVTRPIKTEFGNISFLIAPHGGKNGFDDAVKQEEAREKFKKEMLMPSGQYRKGRVSFAHIRYGGDDGFAAVVQATEY